VENNGPKTSLYLPNNGIPDISEIMLPYIDFIRTKFSASVKTAIKCVVQIPVSGSG